MADKTTKECMFAALEFCQALEELEDLSAGSRRYFRPA